MKTVFYFLLLLCLLIGCSSRPVLGPGEVPTLPAMAIVHADVDFTPAERAEIEGATDAWRRQTSGVANITVVYDLDFNSIQSIQDHQNDIVLVRRTSDMSSVRFADIMSECEGCVLGWTTSGGIHSPDTGGAVDMALIVDRTAGILKQVAMHEFGHLLGLPHVGSRQSIMYPAMNRNRSVCLKQADLQAFCQVNVCGNAVMHPCE